MDSFNPNKIIDFSKNYYEILGISQEELPKGKTRDDKVHLSKILETAFRKKARVCHPDFGGSNEAFLDIQPEITPKITLSGDTPSMSLTSIPFVKLELIVSIKCLFLLS